ncbi:hypothetical protein AgCh_039732 [Apium graveolens]
MEENHSEMVELLVMNGADVNTEDVIAMDKDNVDKDNAESSSKKRTRGEVKQRQNPNRKAKRLDKRSSTRSRELGDIDGDVDGDFDGDVDGEIKCESDGDSTNKDDPDYDDKEKVQSEPDEELVGFWKENNDEKLKMGYVGISQGRKRKKKGKFYNEKFCETHKWKAGLKFCYMDEFRKAVRELVIVKYMEYLYGDRIRGDLDLGDGFGFTIISDQQKGLENAVKKLLHRVEDMICTRHLFVNFKRRSVTVDLDARKCDCRARDLTGILCQHVVATIHDNKYQPISYISQYYSREHYLKAYNLSLEALRGDEFWDSHDKAEMLPPDVPKK